MKRHSLTLAAAILTVLAATAPAHATLVYHWDMNNPTPTADTGTPDTPLAGPEHPDPLPGPELHPHQFLVAVTVLTAL